MGFTAEIIQNALNTLQAEGSILYPTDTIWGIGCDARSTIGVEKIYALKQREDSKALICLVADVMMLEKYVGPIDQQLIPYLGEERPTTIIYPKVEGISNRLKAVDGSVGIRIAKDAFCKALIQALGAPLVSTSANISGANSPTSFDEITTEITDGVNAIVPLKQNEEQTQASRIIRLQANGEIEILRP